MPPKKEILIQNTIYKLLKTKNQIKKRPPKGGYNTMDNDIMNNVIMHNDIMEKDIMDNRPNG